MNKYLAAYRALDRIENAKNIPQSDPGLFTEEITGRFNVREVLAYSMKVALDAGENQEMAINNHQPHSPADIFQRQKENIDLILTTLGTSQRGYNLNAEAVDTGAVNDLPSCAHGVFAHIVGTMNYKHKLVSISQHSPASLADEFNHAVKYEVRNLPAEQKAEVESFQATLNDVTVEVKNQNEIEFKNNGSDFPESYKKVLSKVTKDLDIRYGYLHPNPKLQLVKKQKALDDVFKYVDFIDFSN